MAEPAWCVAVLAATTQLLALPGPERSQAVDAVLQGKVVRAVAAGMLGASALLAGCVGAYRVVAAGLDLCWPRRLVEGLVADRGTVEGGPWISAALGPLVGWRTPPTMRWVAMADQATGRLRTLHVSDRDRWFVATPGARVRVTTTGVLGHVSSVAVVTPDPPLVPRAPFARPSIHHQ